MGNQNWKIQRLHDIGCWRTEGLRKYELPELEIKLSEQEQSAMKYLDIIAKASLAGLHIFDGQMAWGIIRLPIFFFHSPEAVNNNIIRIILPDNNRRFPWEPMCEAEYTQQIKFSTDKVFYLMTQNKWRVNQIRKSIMIKKLAPNFKKRAEGYISPVEYIVNNELFETGSISIRGGLLIDYTREVGALFDIPDITIICKDTDYSDPLNKHFKKYKEQYLR